jgi:hypothetical protein
VQERVVVVGRFLKRSEGAQVHAEAITMTMTILFGRRNRETRRSVRHFGQARIGVLGVLGVNARHVIEMRIERDGDG